MADKSARAARWGRRRSVAALLAILLGGVIADVALAAEPTIEEIGRHRVRNGGTGADNAADARVNLGLDPTSSPVYTGATLSDMTLGSVLFAGTGGLLSQDNANFFFDDTNNRLGVGTAAPADKMHVAQSANSAVGAIIENINAGAGAYTWLQLGNNLDRASGVVRNSTNNTDFAGAGSLNLYNSGAYSIGFITNNVVRMTIDGTTGAVTVVASLLNPGITSDATHTTATVCEDTTTHQFYSGSGAAGICLGTSSLRFKTNVHPLAPGLAEIVGLQPIGYRYKPGRGGEGVKYGFAAEQVKEVMPELVGLDAEGRANSVDWAGIVPVLVKAIQEQQREIAELKRQR